jgi:ceramide glucosyltransferase
MLSGAGYALFLLVFHPSPGKILAAIFLLILCGSTVYSALQILAARDYLSVKPPALTNSEPISILKPLAGLDLDLESNLRTFFEQDYAAFEILFAVRSATDPAADVVARLQKEFPNIPSRPTLLKTIAAEFQDHHIGVATCPYRAVPGPSFWSQLEATGMNTDFWGSALVARMLEGMHFAVGPTIAARQGALRSIGGMERLKDYLAEDFVIGKFAAEGGHGVILSSYVIEHHIGDASLLENVEHRLRWARSTRRSRPVGYFGQLFTMPLPIAALVVACSPSWWPVLPAAIALRAIAAYMVSARVLRNKINWLLLPIEDAMGFLFWMAGFFGNIISWRGRRYRLLSDGRFERIAPGER